MNSDSSNKERLPKVAREADEVQQAGNREYFDRQVKRKANAIRWAKDDLDAWIRVMEETWPRGQYNEGSGYCSWEYAILIFTFGRARWTNRPKVYPRIDLTRFFRARWGGEVDLLVSMDDYVNTINNNLGDKFQISHFFVDPYLPPRYGGTFNFAGNFSWGRKQTRATSFSG
jgi:hypothetical protein